MRASALEAEYQTGRREKTEDEARRSLMGRLARLIGGWVLVLLGLAGLVLPGPGWLIVLVGLTLLPYQWTDNLIRIIRKKIPGIPEDGRIPTRTWVLMGLAVVITTGASLWWGLRDDGEDSDTAAAETPAAAATLIVASSDPGDRSDLTTAYGAVIAEVTDLEPRYVDIDEVCPALRDGRAGLAVLSLDEVTTCFGGTTVDETRANVAAADTKAFAPVEVGGTTYWPITSNAHIAVDDEPVENAIDLVSDSLSGGSSLSDDPAGDVRTILRTAGMVK